MQFILRHEAGPGLLFSPLQSPAGTRILKAHGYTVTVLSTFVLVSDGKVYGFGKADSCLVPTPELRERFLHD